MRLDGVRWEEPAGLDVAERERDFRRAERKRLVYVAATRARDILLIPKVGAPDGRYILGTLLAGGRSPTLLEQPNHTPTMHAAWFDAATPPTLGIPRDTTSRDEEDLERWTSAARAAGLARMAPAAFSDANAARTLWGKRGRFGVVFGETVHLAIGLTLRHEMAIPDAVAAAADRTKLTEHLSAARDDVELALATLKQLGVARTACELEYAVSGVSADGRLVSGYIDLLAIAEGDTVVLDFKTDVPPPAGESPPLKYVAQVSGYAGVVGRAFAVSVRAGILYTADGSVHWLPPNDNVRS
jgi:ATP-dependent helicase/nuclease subunit A